jgi:hypothetical protein
MSKKLEKKNKSSFFRSFFENIKGIDLEKDTIKVRLSHMNKKGEVVVKGAEDDGVFDADDIEFDPATIKPTMMFCDGKCIHFERTGEPITRVSQVSDLASCGKWIWHARWGAIPAHKINKLSAKEVVGFIRMGWLYQYIPKSKS